jgi:hypothetical protein
MKTARRERKYWVQGGMLWIRPEYRDTLLKRFLKATDDLWESKHKESR